MAFVGVVLTTQDEADVIVEIQNAAVEAHLRGLMANADVLMPTEEIDPSILSILDFTSE